MKFILNGIEYADYQLSNEQLLDLLDGDALMSCEKTFIKDKIVERFKQRSCCRKGESEDELFARQFSDYVNRCPNDFKKAANAMSKDHRYLQSEMFKVFMEYVKNLAENYDKGFYDPRNEWACKSAKQIVTILND